MTPNLTINYGLRYDIEFTPTFAATTPIAAAADKSSGHRARAFRARPRTSRRVWVWPGTRLATARRCMRASYGIFFDHPLMALAFDSDVADGTQAPQLLLFGGALTGCNVQNPLGTLNASNAFTGRLTACRRHLPTCPTSSASTRRRTRRPSGSTRITSAAAGSAARSSLRLSDRRQLPVRLFQPGKPGHRAPIRQQHGARPAIQLQRRTPSVPADQRQRGARQLDRAELAAMPDASRGDPGALSR